MWEVHLTKEIADGHIMTMAVVSPLYHKTKYNHTYVVLVVIFYVYHFN